MSSRDDQFIVYIQTALSVRLCDQKTEEDPPRKMWQAVSHLKSAYELIPYMPNTLSAHQAATDWLEYTFLDDRGEIYEVPDWIEKARADIHFAEQK